ncbi:hypothetical protein [Micromonospora sp. WMMC273]|uniref:hypothetical protein n=1 Tax=Micromonospora sp. WMMC273 TaxID=3015157 RepID=UPI0022B6646A|nr:hypothetical protein [Micromonospora sp. WMMC273]MCZ7478908.1 hypothetical protein [Micromonospora sp. WMMC273]
MGTRWRGLLAPIGTSTGDGRRFARDGVSHRELPLPLKWQRTDEMGHDASVIIGMADTIDIRDDGAWGEGELFDDVDPAVLPRLAEDVAEAKHLLAQKVIGPSVDPGAAEAVLAEVGSDEPISEERLEELLEEAWENGTDPALEMLFVVYEIAAATLVSVPAFAECGPFELLTEDAQEPVTASVRTAGWSDMPLAARDASWDGDAAAGRLAGHCGIDGDDPDWGCYAAGFLHRDDDADGETRTAYGFGIVDVIDGTPTIVPAAVFAVASVLEGGRGGTDLPEEEQDRMRQVVSGLYARMADEFDDPGLRAPWDEEEADGEASVVTPALVASLTAAAGLAVTIPAEVFTDPQLSELTFLTVTEPDDNGLRRVFGHIAPWGVCHVGIRDSCTTAPTSEREYADFHRYHETASGVALPMAVGRITTGHGELTGSCRCCPGKDDHACSRLSAGAAIGHHDRMAAVAYVRAGEDEHGIWVAGIVAPEAGDREIAALARQKVSGDWRDMAGGLELVEVLALARERPGFPLPRTTLRNGRQVALVAAGGMDPARQRRPAPDTEAPVVAAPLDYQRLGREIADALRGQPAVTAGAGLVDRDAVAAQVSADLQAEIDAAVQVVEEQERAREARALLAELEVA